MPVHATLYDYWYDFCDSEPTAGLALEAAVKAGYGPFALKRGKLVPLRDLEAFRLAEFDPSLVILIQNRFR